MAPLAEARAAGTQVIGIRHYVLGDTALVPASAGIGTAATLDDIMTHAHKEVA